MSAIPPNWASSIIQSQGAAARAAEGKQRSEADKSVTSTPFAQSVRDVIENSDRDSQVYTDAQGTGAGGQGRSRTEADEDADAEALDDAAAGNPPTGLDIQG